jgi:hypothetical protein
MAIKTVWPVKRSCGHQADHDLSDRRPSERAAFARWLKNKDCSDCWRAAKDRDWLAERRAGEAAAIKSWETHAAMPELDGSDKAVAWGERVRHHLMEETHDHHVLDGEMSDEEFEDRFEAPARTVTSASWWIDQRDTDPCDMEELLADMSEDTTARTAENPY